MAGGSLRHSLLTGNAYHQLRLALQGRPCRVHMADARIGSRSDDGHFYPDVTVVCGATESTEEDRRTLLNPKLIIEVLSPSTAGYDFSTKLKAYTTIPSLTDYVLIAQESPQVTHYHRTGDDRWDTKFLRGLDRVLKLEAFEIEIPLSALYERYEEEALG